jgi:uncharacterized membrane protein
MKIFFSLLLLLLTTTSSASKLCVFDALGNCIERGQNVASFKDFISQNGKKIYYIASEENNVGSNKSHYPKIAPRKIKGKKRWYEVDWNQGVKLCPEKGFNSNNGVWIVYGTAHVDSKNCVYVEGSPFTRSILVLYSRNPNDLTEADSSWILVNQTIVELANKNFKIWDDKAKQFNGRPNKDAKFKVIQLNQDLIVDKTEFRIKDALWLKKGKSQNPLKIDFDYYPEKDSSRLQNYPLEVDADVYNYLQWRSEIDGLQSVFITKSADSVNKLQNLYKHNKFDKYIDVFDTSANGYRMPMKMELKVLQLGGQSSVFSWGDAPDKALLARYMNVKCGTDEWGVYPVKMHQPNQYGLYDVYGNAEELYLEKGINNVVGINYNCNAYDYVNIDIGPACEFIGKYKCRRKSEKNNSSWIGFKGIRLVRKLE